MNTVANPLSAKKPNDTSRPGPIVTHPRSRRASALMIVVSILAASAVAGIAITSVSSISPSTPMLAESTFLPPPPPTSAETSNLLYRLGLAPDRLAAAGVTAAQTTTLVGNLRSHLTDHVEALRMADSDYNAARSLVDALERVVRAGTSSANDRTALTSAQAQLASSVSTRQGLLNSAYTAATSGLSEGALQSLTRAYTNTAWELPGQAAALPYAYADRSEQDWVTLRDALSAQRIATRYGDTPSQGALDIISAAASAPAVSTAASNLQAHLAEVAAAWTAAVGQ